MSDESENKLKYTKELVRCWVDSWGVDGVAVSTSGGKDSQVLLHIVRSMYPEVKGVFSNTGLEYRELVVLMEDTQNIDIVRPKMPFHKVIEKYGWPIISKKVSRAIYDLKNPTERNENVRNLYLTGFNRAGKYCQTFKLAQKWRFLIDSPFCVSNKCCDYLKKEPLQRYAKENGVKYFTGVMMADSMQRKLVMGRQPCNLYDSKKPISRPLTHWNDTDIWAYIHNHDIPYASVYDKGEKRTGCVFCMFGIMYDKDRFLRLKINSPKQYDYVINKLGAAEVLEFIGIPY